MGNNERYNRQFDGSEPLAYLYDKMADSRRYISVSETRRFITAAKGGGIRIIYYYHDNQIPLFLLTVYAKAQKEDLSAKEKTAMRRLVEEIVKTYPH